MKQYESVKKSAVHQKYENEIDILMNGEEFKNTAKKELSPDVEMQDVQSSEGSDISDDEEVQQFKSAADRKRYLLKMMEKKGNTNSKQVFNFEEEDVIQTVPQEIPTANGNGGKRGRGRPAFKQ